MKERGIEMAKRGSGSSSRSGKGYAAGRAMVDDFNVSGTAKQISYARDIMKRPFDWIQSNLARQNENISNAKSASTKRTYEGFAKEYKDFGTYITNSMYKPMRDSKKEIKASDIISTQYRFDGQKLFSVWKSQKK